MVFSAVQFCVATFVMWPAQQLWGLMLATGFPQCMERWARAALSLLGGRRWRTVSLTQAGAAADELNLLRRGYAHRRCVVTGAASGIGLACVRRLCEAGARVLAVDRDRAALARLSSVLGPQYSSLVHNLVLDVTATDAGDILVERAVELMGGIDVFLNNAGVLVHGRFEAHSVDQIRALSEVNFVAPIALANAVLPLMHQQGYGSILFTASLSSWLYPSTITVYAGTKAGIKQFVRSFRRELASTHPQSGIHLAAIYPNIVNTPMVPTAVDQVSSSAFQDPRDVANAMLFGLLERRSDIYVSEADWLLATLEMVCPQLLDFLIPIFFGHMLPDSEKDVTHGVLANAK